MLGLSKLKEWREEQRVQAAEARVYEDIAQAITISHNHYQDLMAAHQKYINIEQHYSKGQAARQRSQRIAESYMPEYQRAQAKYSELSANPMCKLLQYGKPSDQINDLGALGESVVFEHTNATWEPHEIEYSYSSQEDQRPSNIRSGEWYNSSAVVGRTEDINHYALFAGWSSSMPECTVHGRQYRPQDYEGTGTVTRFKKRAGYAHVEITSRCTVKIKESAYTEELKQLRSLDHILQGETHRNIVVEITDHIVALNTLLLELTETARQLHHILDTEELDDLEEIDELDETARSLIDNQFRMS